MGINSTAKARAQKSYDRISAMARMAYAGAKEKTRQAYEGAKVAHGKYNAYQEERYNRNLAAMDKRYEEVRRKERIVKGEANIKRYENQKKQYGAAGMNERRITNNMDRQGGYTGGYKQYGGEAPLFHQPVYKKKWYEL